MKFKKMLTIPLTNLIIEWIKMWLKTCILPQNKLENPTKLV